jgi:hypothetical protein
MFAIRSFTFPVFFVLVAIGSFGARSAVGHGASRNAADNPVPSVASLSPWVLFAGAKPQAVTIAGTNFLPSSSVIYNGTSHAATFVSATSLKIDLTAADLAKSGAYPVVVANPPPGGGASAAVKFIVVDDEARLRKSSEMERAYIAERQPNRQLSAKK